MSVFLFFQGFLPTLIPLVGAAVFAGVAALKRRESAIWVLFLSVIFALLGVVATRVAIVSAASAQAAGIPLADRASFIKAASSIGHAMPILTGVASFIGWTMFALKKPNQPPQTTTGSSAPDRV